MKDNIKECVSLNTQKFKTSYAAFCQGNGNIDTVKSDVSYAIQISLEMIEEHIPDMPTKISQKLKLSVDEKKIAKNIKYYWP